MAKLKYQNLPKNLALINASDNLSSVKIVLHGPKNILNNSISNIEIPVNLNNVTQGQNKIKIFATGINLPEGFKLVEIIPDEITVTIDKKTEKKVLVVPELSGEPSENFEIEKTTVTPSHIIVKGPETLLKSMSEIKTEIININGLAKSVILETQINIHDNAIHINDNSKLLVNIKITEKRIEKKLQNIRLEVISDNTKKVNISPELVSVIIKGPKNMIDSIGSDNLHGKIYIKNAFNGKAKPVFDLPDNIEIISVHPNVINILETN